MMTHSSDYGYILDYLGWFITSGEDYIFNPVLVFNHISTVNIILLYFKYVYCELYFYFWVVNLNWSNQSESFMAISAI